MTDRQAAVLAEVRDIAPRVSAVGGYYGVRAFHVRFFRQKPEARAAVIDALTLPQIESTLRGLVKRGLLRQGGASAEFRPTTVIDEPHAR